MIRIIARYLIQKAYDDSLADGTDPLHPWLRKWVKADPQLLSYEQDIQRLEDALRSGMESFVSQNHYTTTSPHGTVLSLQQDRVSKRAIAKQYGFALAAGLLFIAMSIGMTRFLYFGTPTSKPLSRIDTTLAKPNESISDNRVFAKAEQELDDAWMAAMLSSSVELSKGFANRVSWTQLKQTGIRKRLANSTSLDAEHFQSVYRGGLNFVVKQLPAATVRMLGLGTQDAS